jgi:predicted TPR repeat methyltransferase
MSALTSDPVNARGPVESRCRFCGSGLLSTFVDLGMSPLCESFLRADELNRMEPFYPLHVFVCGDCFLVQLGEYVSPHEIFHEYAYFSSYSHSWVRHAEKYAEAMIRRFGIDGNSRVVEIASNDGYLLQHFVRRGIPCLGIEPAENVAQVAIRKGVPTITRFFGTEVAKEISEDHGKADLLVGNNVLAHVPDLNDFVLAMSKLLGPHGLITMEFPHLHRLIQGNQFDTIYHEHFSYFSFLTVSKVFEAHGLFIFDVEELPSHGGSLRIYARHANDGSNEVLENVERLRNLEQASGYDRIETYSTFEDRVHRTKHRFLEFLVEAKRNGKSIVNYGAPGKGNTLLNYCGIRQDFVDYAVDRNAYKHGRYTPGTHIPIFPPERIQETRPDIIAIMPWNLRNEISHQLTYTAAWGAQLVVPIPQLEVFEPGTQTELSQPRDIY